MHCSEDLMRLIDFAFSRMDSEPNTVILLSDENGSAIVVEKKDMITVDFENNFPNNINT